VTDIPTVLDKVIEQLPPEQRLIMEMANALDNERELIDELGKRLDLVAEQVYQDNLEETLKKWAVKIDTTVKLLGDMKDIVVALNERLNDLEKWSNVHTHAQSEELKYETKMPRAKLDHIASRRKARVASKGVRGKFCLQCHKRLNEQGRNQRIFCSPTHASQWYREHPNDTPYPLTKLMAGGFETKVTAGEAVESEAYAARP